jgi:hypothetical protein
VLPPVEPHATDAFSLRCADGVSLENCSVNWRENSPGYFQDSVHAEAATALRISNFAGDSALHPLVVQ